MKKSVEVVEFKLQTVQIPIIGISPLIVHKFSEKAKKQILDKQLGKSKSSKHDIKDPQMDYEGAKHVAPDGWEGFPAAGFKKAMIRGAKIIGMVMKDAQMAFFIKPDCEQSQLIRIHGESIMREDMVRVGMGSADVRFRPEYPEWEAVLNIEFNAGNISIDQIFQLVRAAGHGCGVGEMRPEKGGYGYGRFTLKS